MIGLIIKFSPNYWELNFVVFTWWNNVIPFFLISSVDNNRKNLFISGLKKIYYIDCTFSAVCKVKFYILNFMYCNILIKPAKIEEDGFVVWTTHHSSRISKSIILFLVWFLSLSINTKMEYNIVLFKLKHYYLLM